MSSSESLPAIAEQDLLNCIQLLISLRDPTRTDHQFAMQSLDQNILNVSFVIHLFYLFTHGNTLSLPNYPILPLDLRQLSGLIIKNYIFPQLTKYPQELQTLIKQESLRLLTDEIIPIRKLASLLLGKIAEIFPVDFWVDILLPLYQGFDELTNIILSAHPAPVGASLQPTIKLASNANLMSYISQLDSLLQAIFHIVEDSSVKLSIEQNVRPLDSLIPKLIKGLSIPYQTIRMKILDIYNCLLYLLETGSGKSSPHLRTRNTSFDSNTSHASSNSNTNINQLNAANVVHSTALLVNIPNFLTLLSQLSQDNNIFVKKRICLAINIMTSLHIAILEPYFPSICEFMLSSLAFKHESSCNGEELEEVEKMQFEACEFWAVLSIQDQSIKGFVQQTYLARLIPLLITNCYLTTEQLENERFEDEEDEEEDENNQGIAPSSGHISGSRSSHGNGNTSSNSINTSTTTSSYTMSQQVEDLQTTEDNQRKWTIRKQAAMTLDTLSTQFLPKDILQHSLPMIQTYLNSNDIFWKECGMLVLGALSQGCMRELSPYIATLLPFWLTNLQDNLPEIRSITSWVMSRYVPLLNPHYYESELEYEINGTEESFNLAYQDCIQFYSQSFQHLLTCIQTEKNIKVQRALASALCIYIENSYFLPPSDSSNGAQVNIVSSHVPILLNFISKSLNHYKWKNKLIIIDLLGTISDHLSLEMKLASEFIPHYFPFLLNTLNEITNPSDIRLFPILETFLSLIGSIGEALPQEHIVSIYIRMVSLVQQMLFNNHNPHGFDNWKSIFYPQNLPPFLWTDPGDLSNSGPTTSTLLYYQRLYEDLQYQVTEYYLGNPIHQMEKHIIYSEDKLKDAVVCCLDLLAVISEKFGAQLLALVEHTHTHEHLVILSLSCCLIPQLTEIHQSAYSLLGELVKFAHNSSNGFQLISHTNNQVFFTSWHFYLYFQQCLQHLIYDLDSIYVKNNIIWVFGEFIIRCQDNCWMQWIVNEYLSFFLEHTLTLLHQYQPEIQDCLLMNIAICYGRISMQPICRPIMNELLIDAFVNWSQILIQSNAQTCPPDEFEQSLLGMLYALEVNPSILLTHKQRLHTFFALTHAIVNLYLQSDFHHIQQHQQEIFTMFHKLFIFCSQGHHQTMFTKVWNSFINNYDPTIIIQTFQLTLPTTI